MGDLTELTPGSPRGDIYVKRIVDYIREYVDYVTVIDIPVYSWTWDCVIRIGDREEKCILLPYSPSIQIEINGRDIIRGDSRDIGRFASSNRVIAIDHPLYPWDLRIRAYTLSKSNPLVVILVSSTVGLLKSDLVLGSPGFTYNTTMPINTPFISIHPGIFESMRSRDVVIEAKSTLEKSMGKIITAWINGRGEREIHLLTHYDCIIGDRETVSSEALIELLKYIHKVDIDANTRVIFYTAREIGDVEFTEYHYTWGERYLLNILDNRGELDNVSMGIAIGPLSGFGELTAISTPLLGDLLSEVDVVKNHNILYTEASPYMDKGIPVVVFTTRDHYIYRNSTMGRVNREAVNKLLELIPRIMSVIDIDSHRSKIWKSMRDFIVNTIGEREVELRVELTRFLDLIDKSRDSGFLRYPLSIVNSLIEVYCENGEYLVEESTLSDISTRSIEKIKHILDTCSENIVLGNKKNYVVFRTRSDFTNMFLNHYRENLTKYYREMVDNELLRLNCSMCIERCLTSGEKSDRDR